MATMLAGGAAALAAAVGIGSPLEAQASHLVIVAGLGGGPDYTAAFTEWALELRRAAVERYGVPPEHVTVLAEEPGADPALEGESRREGVEAALATLAERSGPDDRVLVVFIGHGSTRNGQARINLPGPDMTAAEISPLLDAVSASHLAVVNTASASGPWVETLARPGRTVIAATRTAGERNETRFGDYFSSAWSEDNADVDKDGGVSLLEAFTWAYRETDRFYDEADRLKTEHAVLDDDGDGRGTETPTAEAADGALAATFTLGAPLAGAGRAGAAAGGGDAAPPPATADSVLVRLYAERSALEDRVAELRRQRDELDPERYEARLEELLVEIALKTREIRAREGGER
jgi:hypothetical protein